MGSKAAASPYIATAMKEDDGASLSDEQIHSLLMEAESRLLNSTQEPSKNDKEETLSLSVAANVEGPGRPR